MPTLRLLAALALGLAPLVGAAQTTARAPADLPRPTAEADSLIDLVIGEVGYDRFLDRTFPAGGLDVPYDLPRAANVRRHWDALVTPAWFRRQVRLRFAEATGPDELRALLVWLDDPVVRRAIERDYEAGARDLTADMARLTEARAAGTSDPRFEAAVGQIVRAAGGAEKSLRFQGMRVAEFILYAAEDAPLARRPTRAHLESLVETSIPRALAETDSEYDVVIAARFEGFPVEDLEHYAEALAAPAGQTYLRLVVDAPIAALLDGIRLSLDKARK